MACWRKGKAGVASDGAGHVAIVEKIASDGTVTFSNSNYSGTRFFLMKMKKPYNLGSTFAFQGFIYPPINFSGTDKVTSKMWTSGANYPTSIKKGSYFTIKGTLKSNLAMKRVCIEIVDKNGKAKFKYEKTTTAKTYDIHKADSAMQFRKLAKGTYYYKVGAWDNNGYHTVLKKKFTVK